MNANVDYTSELRGLVQDNPNCPCKIKKEYFKAHDLEFHYTVKYKIDNEYERDYLVQKLATMGYEGAYMCKWSITDDGTWITPEELYNRVMELVLKSEKHQNGTQV
ncbi:hypothetical protein J4E91_005458 [Alternaria rosae]|nr:hypothetical protein J4E91_005458 [Alternaria rosae]